jgi:hypothetical protein
MKPVFISIQVTDLEKGFLKVVAEQRDHTSLATLIKHGAHLYAMFDPVFIAKIKAMAEATKLPEYLVIQNMIIKRMAEDAADEEVNGVRPQSLPEFSFTEKGPITGEELFNMLKSREVQRLEAEKEIQLIQESQYAPLSPEDSEWLKKRMEQRDSKPLHERLKEYREKGLTAVFSKEEKAKLLAEVKAKHQKQE